MDFKSVILGIAIFIMTIFVGVYGISTLYGESPQYDEYCPNNLINQSICESENGVWTNNTQMVADVKGDIRPIQVEGGYCNYDFTQCQNELESAEKSYYKKVFLTALPLGIVIIFLGAVVFGLEAVGAGLMAGGVAVMVYGTGSYWRFTDDWLKFLLSLVGLVIVIWMAYYFNREFGKKNSAKKKRR
jgi:divalent metal cation (Fe/Co/Zn/Cd) transporter